MRLSLRYATCSLCDNENVPAVYDPESDTIEIFLPVVSKVGDDDEVMKYLISIINHEVMHHIFKEIIGKQTIERVEIEHKVMKKLGME